MQAPKLPSFFKAPKYKSFSFNPRYYDKRKERRKQLETERKAEVKFNNYNNTVQKERSAKIIFLIIILSLLAYNLIIN